jgi:hypothetical protein
MITTEIQSTHVIDTVILFQIHRGALLKRPTKKEWCQVKNFYTTLPYAVKTVITTKQVL